MMPRRNSLSGPCSVYVMTCHSGQETLAKVGVSKNPRKRSFEVQTGCPLQIDGLYVSEARNRAAALAAEHGAHCGLAKFRTRGEWFRLQSTDLEAFFSIVESALREVRAGALERIPMMAHQTFRCA